MTPPSAGQPGHGSEAVLRSQPVRIVDGGAEGGYTDMYELVCPSCGDRPDLDYSEISPRLQWLRGPYGLEAALAVFHKHQGIPWPTPGRKLQGPGQAKARTYNHYPNGWAMAFNAPFKMWKRQEFNGRTADPCIISWPSATGDA